MMAPLKSGWIRPRRAPIAGQRPLGIHLSIAGGVSNALRAAVRLRATALQIFVKNQRQWRAPPLAPADIAEWTALRDRSRRCVGGLAGRFAVIAHAAYLINLASAERALLQRSREAYAEELLRCAQLDIAGLVVHPGSWAGSSRARSLARVAAGLNDILERHPDVRTRPLLEVTAGQGCSLGSTFAELGEILSRLREPQRVGICIDTCHVFAAGYDLRRPEGYNDLITEAQREVGLERVLCWHVNDSRTPCGSRVDRHAHLGAGLIGPAGFRPLLADPRWYETPLILETPKGTDERGRDLDALNLRRLRSWTSRLRQPI